MKNSLKCVKCNSSNIKRICQKESFECEKILLGSISWVPLTRYLCMDCGYSEEWIDTKEELDEIAEKL